MNRLTEYRKDLKRYEYKLDERGYCYISEGQIVNKLGKLEDILEKHNISNENLEQILTEYEAIENANPSEALECLENIGFAPLNECCGSPYTRISDEYEDDYNTIKQALETKSKKELAFDVIKEKDVDIQRLVKCINLTAYNNGLPKKRQLTREEFDLLKEVLE